MLYMFQCHITDKLLLEGINEISTISLLFFVLISISKKNKLHPNRKANNLFIN